MEKEGDLMTLLHDSTTRLLVRGLDASSAQHRAHAHNLANVNTPGFKRSYVSFDQVFREAIQSHGMRLAKTHPGHQSGSGQPHENPIQTEKDMQTSMRPDGNNVDVDREMTELAINQLYYQALVQQVNERTATVRYVINEGRR
jgi:flagellar basal-body rod protein FlgB